MQVVAELTKCVVDEDVGTRICRQLLAKFGV